MPSLGRVRLAAVAAVLAVTAAGCGGAVAGVSVNGSVAGPTTANSTAPSTTDPSTTDPSTTDPSTTDPSTTDPSTTDPSTTDPSTTDPSTTDPSATDGASTPSPPVTSDSSGTGDPSSSSGPDDAKLYPTEPIPYNVTPNTEGIASLVEARRLAGYVLDPGQIEVGLTEYVGIPTYPLRDSQGLTSIFADSGTPLIAKRQGMYTGYSAARSDPANKSSMVLAAFVFPSADAAKKASAAMANSSKDKSDTAVAFPSLPGAAGSQGAVGSTAFSGQAFVAAGAVVAYVYVSGGVSQKAGVPKRMATALTREIAMLKGYTPTPQSKLMEQEFDPTGLYARTLPPAKNLTPYGMYSRQGSLHTQAEAVASEKILSGAGVDVVSIGRSVLYRAKDAAGAAAVRDAFYAQEVANNTRYRDFDPGTSAGAARCLQDSVQSQYVCYATVDRITIEYSSQSERDLKRSLEAQVALLQQ